MVLAAWHVIDIRFAYTKMALNKQKGIILDDIDFDRSMSLEIYTDTLEHQMTIFERNDNNVQLDY